MIYFFQPAYLLRSATSGTLNKYRQTMHQLPVVQDLAVPVAANLFAKSTAAYLTYLFLVIIASDCGGKTAVFSWVAQR